jgi:hypothetical protein
MNAPADIAEPVIVGAEITAGHDGSAELTVRLRQPNGVETPVTLDARMGLALLRRCGATHVDDLAGHSWRNILQGDEPCST